MLVAFAFVLSLHCYVFCFLLCCYVSLFFLWCLLVALFFSLLWCCAVFCFLLCCYVFCVFVVVVLFAAPRCRRENMGLPMPSYKEVSEGWVEAFRGTLDEARDHFPKGLALGKLGLALSDSRPPRLVMDASISGVNSQSRIPEKSLLLTANDVLRCFPLRNSAEPLGCFSLDIQSAHKRIAVPPCHRGYLGFQVKGRFYFYGVCPLGASVSAHFWSCLAGALVRLWHRFVWLPHAAYLYVDDFLRFSNPNCYPSQLA